MLNGQENALIEKVGKEFKEGLSNKAAFHILMTLATTAMIPMNKVIADGNEKGMLYAIQDGIVFALKACVEGGMDLNAICDCDVKNLFGIQSQEEQFDRILNEFKGGTMQ